MISIDPAKVTVVFFFLAKLSMVVNPFIGCISSASVLTYWLRSLVKSAVIQYSPCRLLRSRDFSNKRPKCLYFFYRKSDYSWRKITAWPLGMTQLWQPFALRGFSEVRVVIFDLRWEMTAAFLASESIFVLQKKLWAVLEMIHMMNLSDPLFFPCFAWMMIWYANDHLLIYKLQMNPRYS